MDQQRKSPTAIAEAQGNRNNTIESVKRDPNHKVEQFGANGSTFALKDSSGKIRDIQYPQGDVRFRTFEYDQSGRVSRMTLLSDTKGVQVWTRQADGKFTDKFGGRHGGDLRVDQNTGNVTIIEANNSVRTYLPEGRFVSGMGPQPQGGDRGPRPPQDGGRGAQPPYDGGRGAQPPQGGDRSVRPPQGGDRSVRPPQGGDRTAPPPYGGDRGPQGDAPIPPRNPQVEKLYTDFYGPRQITDKDNYKDNLWDAAANKKPIVMTFYRSGEPQSADVLRAVADAKQRSGGQAEFMCVDLDKVDPNSAIGRYAHGHIGKRPFGTPLTMVFTQQQGPEQTPVVPDKPLHHQRGAVNTENLLAGIAQAVQIQQTRDIRVPQRDTRPDTPPAPTDRPTDAPRVRPGPTPEQLVQVMQAADYTPAKTAELMKGMSIQDQVSLLRDCKVGLSNMFAKRERDLVSQGQDPARDQELAVISQVYSRSREMMGFTLLPEVVKNNWNVADLKRSTSSLTGRERYEAMNDVAAVAETLVAKKEPGAEKLAGKVHAMSGLVSFDLGADCETEMNKPGTSAERKTMLGSFVNTWKENGLRSTLLAARYDSSIYSSDSYGQALLNSGLQGRAPEFLLTKGRENYKWWEPSADEIQKHPQKETGAWNDSFKKAMKLIDDQAKIAPERPRVRPQATPVRDTAPVTPAVKPADKPQAGLPADKPVVPIAPSDKPGLPLNPNPSRYGDYGEIPGTKPSVPPRVVPRVVPVGPADPNRGVRK